MSMLCHPSADTSYPIGDLILGFLNKTLVLINHYQTDMKSELSLEVAKSLCRFTLALSLFPMGEKRIMFSRPIRVEEQ